MLSMRTPSPLKASARPQQQRRRRLLWACVLVVGIFTGLAVHTASRTSASSVSSLQSAQVHAASGAAVAAGDAAGSGGMDRSMLDMDGDNNAVDEREMLDLDAADGSGRVRSGVAGDGGGGAAAIPTDDKYWGQEVVASEVRQPSTGMPDGGKASVGDAAAGPSARLPKAEQPDPASTRQGAQQQQQQQPRHAKPGLQQVAGRGQPAAQGGAGEQQLGDGSATAVSHLLFGGSASAAQAAAESAGAAAAALGKGSTVAKPSEGSATDDAAGADSSSSGVGSVSGTAKQTASAGSDAVDATGGNGQQAVAAQVAAEKRADPVRAAAADELAAAAAATKAGNTQAAGGGAGGGAAAAAGGGTAAGGGSGVQKLPAGQKASSRQGAGAADGAKQRKQSSAAGAAGRQQQKKPSAADAAAVLLGKLTRLERTALEERQVDTGIVHQGNLARVRSFMHKLISGVAVHVAVVGGSISAGMGDTGFAEVTFQRISDAFQQPGHRFHNGAVGGVMSTYMTSCLKWHVPADIDMIMVEFNVNDGFPPEYCAQLPCRLDYGGLNSQLRRSYERLLRKLLMLPHRPAVVMVQTFDFSERLFMNSGEDQLGVLAQLYSLPWLSFRGAVWRAHHLKQPGYSLEDMLLPGGGDRHPNTRGHQMLADLVSSFLRRVGEGLISRPFTPADQALVDEDLLPPVLPGNIAWDEEYCMIDAKFRELVSQAPGFQWVDEKKAHHLTHKWGFVATEPDSALVFTVNTAMTTQTGVEEPYTAVTINHLKSYENMGQFEVACVKGCKCVPIGVDGHWEQRNSQLSMARISVSQAEECTMKITVLPQTSSGRHKVKIQGIVIADEASAANEFSALQPQIIPADLMGRAKVGSIPN